MESVWLLLFHSRNLADLAFIVVQIDVVLYFAPIVFEQAGFTSQRASFLASGMSGLVLTICTIPTQIWMDKWGRRIPLVAGGAAMGLCLVIIGSIYAHSGVFGNGAPMLHEHSAHWLVMALIYIFVASFALSWGVVSGQRCSAYAR